MIMKFRFINEDYTHNKDGEYYKGFQIVPFSYTMHYGNKKHDVNCVVLVLPESSKKNGFDISVSPEDEEGNEINFANAQEAKDYLDKYDGRLHLENRWNELHLVVE